MDTNTDHFIPLVPHMQGNKSDYDNLNKLCVCVRVCACVCVCVVHTCMHTCEHAYHVCGHKCVSIVKKETIVSNEGNL